LSDCQDGKRDDRAEPLIQQYSLILDRYLEAHPELAKDVVRCAGCKIRFLTHPRNRGRTDLRCPLGCRERHRRECGNQRSRRYYQTAEGRAKKELRNADRTGWTTPEDQSLPLAPSDGPKEPEVGSSSESLEASEFHQTSDNCDSSGVVECFDGPEDSDVSEVSKDSEVADGLGVSSHSAALHAVDVRDGSAVVDRSEVTDGFSAVTDALGTADSVGVPDSVGAANALAAADGAGAAETATAADGVVVADAAGPKPCPVAGCEAPPELVDLSIPFPSEIPAPGEDPLVWELGGVKLTAWLVATTPMLPYVQLLLKEIGSLGLCRDCLIKWLLERLRQRSMSFRWHRQYVLRFLHLHPP